MVNITVKHCVNLWKHLKNNKYIDTMVIIIVKHCVNWWKHLKKRKTSKLKKFRISYTMVFQPLCDTLVYSRCFKIMNISCGKAWGKNCRPRSDCFWRSSLIREFPVCYSDKHFVNLSLITNILCENWKWKVFEISKRSNKTVRGVALTKYPFVASSDRQKKRPFSIAN